MNGNETRTETTVGGVLDARVAGELVERARVGGLALTGPDGLLGQITKNVIQAALEAEMTRDGSTR